MYVPIVCTEPESGNAFIQAVAGLAAPAPQAEILFDRRPVRLETLATNPETHAGWQEKVNQASAALLLIHFMDVAALQALRTRYARLATNRQAPFAAVLLRHEGEEEFKISCSSCGQKLWMREEDMGKKGRCPNCAEAFIIPSAMDYLRDRLCLPGNVPVMRVTRGNVELCRGAMANLLARTASGLVGMKDLPADDMLKRATVPIQIDQGSVQVG